MEWLFVWLYCICAPSTKIINAMNVSCLQGGRLIDPENNIDRQEDLYFVGGKIANKSEVIDAKKIEYYDVRGKIIFPGLVDLRTHLKYITSEKGENILSLTKAASSGGYTTILLIPDTETKADNSGTIQYIQDRIRNNALINVLICGCLTKGAKGSELAPLGSLKEIGVTAISDCPKSIQDNQIFSKGVEYASMFNLPVIDLPRDQSLSLGGSAHDGPIALKMGLGGYPRIAEELYVQRAISVASSLGTKIHVTSISSHGSVEMLREAKKRNVLISSDVTAHHLFLTEESISEYDPNFKTSPPLREEKDRKALINGLLDGTIDCISSAHEPHEEHVKNVEYDLAPSGVIGLETTLSVALKCLKEEKGFSWLKLISYLSSNPSRIMELEVGSFQKGKNADIVVFDPERKWTVQREGYNSNAINTPFEKSQFTGKVVKTFVNGELVFEE